MKVIETLTTPNLDEVSPTAPRPQSTVRAAERTLALLTLFTTSREPELTLDTLARRARLPKSTVHRLLETLGTQGFVEPGAARGLYRLGPSAAALGHTAIRTRRPSPEVTNALTRVSVQVGGGLGISVRVNRDALIVERGSTGRAPSWRVGVGATLPCHTTAVGHALLSGLPDGEIHRMYRGPGHGSEPGTFQDGRMLDDLLTRVRQVRERGYALDDEEFEAGLRCVGVPVVDATGNVTHALGLTLRAAELEPPLVGRVVEPMRRFARILGRHTERLVPDDAPGVRL